MEAGKQRAAMVAYMDGSAVLELVTDGPGAALARQVWERATVVASSCVVEAEVRAALAAERRDRALDEDGLRAACAELERIASELELVPVDRALGADAGGHAERHGLAAPAAIHLAALLAVEARRVVVATWDGELGAAAARAGMPVVPGVAAPAA